MKKILFLVLVLFACAAEASIPNDPFSFTWSKEPIKASKGETVSAEITMNMPAGYFLYKDRTDVEFTTLEGIRIKDVVYPAAEKKESPAGEGTLDVYTDGGKIQVNMSVPEVTEDGVYDVSAIIHYEGCSDKVCLRPSESYIEWKVFVGNVSAEDVQAVAQPRSIFEQLKQIMKSLNAGASESILKVELKWLFIIAFIGGILSSLTPCILPLIPVTMLIIGVTPHKNWKGNLVLSLALIFGMSIAFAILGIAASLLGLSFGFLFQSKLFLFFLVIILFLLGLSLMGVYTMQLPLGLRNLLGHLGGKGLKGAFLSGVSMGLLATPCIGPVIAALLVYSATTGNVKTGFLLLLTYGIGLGMVIVLIGTWYGTLIGGLKKGGAVWVKKLIGLLLILTSLYYLNSIIPFMTLIDRSENPIKWREDHSQLISPAKNGTRPAMVFFTAEWCPPCKVLKFFTLRSPEIVKLSAAFDTIVVDMTDETATEQMIAGKYGAQGWPTIVFLSPEGLSFEDLKVFGGYLGVDELAERMEEALKRSRVK